ncbi:MAG: glutamate 5-kinase [Actinomycetota bacterium]|nr:glutamate 5-kinase [Acidimicrobiaceae bacterium]MEC7915457.1 glutamate 5-kinase [Actinomycetota bacterium]MEC9473199.1 glutamate 5-kinase [Actinomycetota bacterium]MEE3255646.1 glutamate 5-kinase [Actinomycetota bacterium]
MRVIVKIGTSSLTGKSGEVNVLALSKLVEEVVAARVEGHEIVVVTSGAITAGVQRLGIERPDEPEILQAISAVGQIDLMRAYGEEFGSHGVATGQVLLAPHDFRDRNQYLHAETTFEHLIRLNVVPIVNENDAVADDAIRYGDNDRIAALVANLLRADLLVLLTDTPGVLTADPRIEPNATLIEEIAAIDRAIEEVAGNAGSRGSGGMASKLAAARMASWSGVRTVIAAADRPDVVSEAIAGISGIGTAVPAREARIAARKLWIGFAVTAHGRVTVDDGAAQALCSAGGSLLIAGITGSEGPYDLGDAVDVVNLSGEVFAKGLISFDSETMNKWKGSRAEELPSGISPVAIHRDDLVILEEPQ